MSNALFAPQSVAHYQFLDGYVSLSRWSAPAKARLEAAFALADQELPSRQISQDRALLMHEFTHFLDATTTTWGLEMAYRKARAVSLIRQGSEDTQDAIRVLMLNLGEIVAHHFYVEGPMVETLGDDHVMVHQLIEDERFGILVLVHFMKAGEIVHTMPLTMLSLLEAHAYANEALLGMSDARRNPDAGAALVECALVANKLIKSLADPELSEYTVLIRFVRLHFPALNVEQQLELVVALARFSLDVDSMTMSRMAGQLGFQNRYLGEALIKDMQRGASRAVLFFKTIFGLHEAVQSNSHAGLAGLLEDDPRAAISAFWARRFGADGFGLDEFGAMFDKMPKGSGLLDEQVLALSARHNRALLESTPAGRIPFSRFLLPDALLGDNTPVRPPGRLDIDIELVIDVNLAVLGRLQSMCADDKVAKFFMSPAQADEIGLGILLQSLHVGSSSD